MYKETLNIFFGIQRHQFYLLPMGIIVLAEGGFSILQGQDPVIGDGYMAGITAQIRDDFPTRSKDSLQ